MVSPAPLNQLLPFHIAAAPDKCGRGMLPPQGQDATRAKSSAPAEPAADFARRRESKSAAARLRAENRPIRRGRVPRPWGRHVLREQVERRLVRVEARIDDLPGRLRQAGATLVQHAIVLGELLTGVQRVELT